MDKAGGGFYPQRSYLAIGAHDGRDTLRMTKIGILGFGEAGSAFASALADAGAEVFCYDLRWDEDDDPSFAQRDAGNTAIAFCRLPALLGEVEIILSVVTTDAALDAANACLPRLAPGQVYCDLNSTAPSLKQRLERIMTPSGAAFVEGAILGAIGVTGAKTQILLGGAPAEDLSAVLNRFGLDTTPYSREIGKASTFKMLRSVFSKGLEALLVEFLAVGRKAGLQDDLWREVTGLMAAGRFERVARNWVCSHATAHQRREHEMRQVTELLRELDFDAIMTEAAERFFARSSALDLSGAFDSRPESMREVVDALLERLPKGRRK